MILLKGGTVVSSKGCIKQDVLIQGEKIRKVAHSIECKDAQVIDATNRLLFPGFIDAHTHFDLSVANTVTADDFTTGTKAAIRGGTTTIIDFATQYKQEALHTAFANWMQKAEGKSSCDYGFHMSISDWNPQVNEELSYMIELGITSFKLYMTYDAMKVSDCEIFEILTELKKVGGIAGVHCENSGIIAALVKQQQQNGEYGVKSHAITRPAIAEAEAIHRLLCIAKLVNTPIIIVHLSSKEGFQVIQRARKQGQKVYVETCPQYLLLEESLYELPNFLGADYVMAPPLRTKVDQDCLRNAIQINQIQTISTDHCSFTREQKKLGVMDFTKIPGGIPGVETRVPLMLTFGKQYVNQWESKLCQLLSENPSKLYGMYPRKGCIQEGSDADIVVYDVEGMSELTAKHLIQNVDYTPYEGFTICGSIDKVLLRGQIVVEKEEIKIESVGRYIKRGEFAL